MPFVDGDDVVAALAPERPDHPLGGYGSTYVRFKP